MPGYTGRYLEIPGDTVARAVRFKSTAPGCSSSRESQFDGSSPVQTGRRQTGPAEHPAAEPAMREPRLDVYEEPRVLRSRLLVNEDP